MNIAYFDCFSGISGDMAIAAFLDAGLKLSVLSRELGRLNIAGYRLKQRRVKRGALSGTKFECIKTTRYSGHRSLDNILKLISKSGLSSRVKSVSSDIFNNIGSAESKIHGFKKRDQVWLHELGDIDSIIDIVGVAVAIDELDIGEVYSSDINMGRTVVKTAHGNLPIPGPAALELLRSAPVKILNIESELVTPTGAGILKTLSMGFGPMPKIKISGIGYGAGSSEIEALPNMLRVIIGSKVPALKEDRVTVLETNIDDMNPQYFEHVFEELFACGALDVYSTPIQMKKMRPAVKLTAICKPEDLDRLSTVIFRETTTIGIRSYETDRIKLTRKSVTAKTEYGPVLVKVSSGSGGVLTASPEYDDCLKIARAKKIPLRMVYDKAKETAYENI